MEQQQQATLDLRPLETTHVHPPPNLARVSRFLTPSRYSPSRDGVNQNLLILLHGLGDTAAPFAQLGHSLNLPQTAILSLQGPERVPLLEEEAYQWWDSFTELGELIPNPNPSATLHLLLSLLSHLTAPVSPSPSSSDKAAGTAGGCGWHPSQIHLFGYAQGGTCAAELALAWARAHPIPPPSSAGASSASPSASPSPAQQTPPGLTAHLGSLVSISAPLLSHPTPSPSTLARTRALVLFRPGADERAVVPAAYQRGFVRAEAFKLPPGPGRGAEGMLRGRDEWERVMRFWSEVLGRKSALELSGEVYEVAQGGGAGGCAAR